MSYGSPVVIVGGGVIGCGIAYELSKNIDDDIFLIERNLEITKGENQSSRNSGVIHAGIYYPKTKGPLKAKFCVEGNKMLYDFCAEHDVPHKRAGKLVVATNPREEEYLNDVFNTAKDNGVPEFRRISGKEAESMEPNVKATSALLFPTSGIIEPKELVYKLQTLAKQSGVYFVTGTTVVDIRASGRRIEISTSSKDGSSVFEAKTLINAAGLYSDEIARMINPDSPYEMDPVRGEAAKFYRTKRDCINMTGMNVYPAPYGFFNDTGEKAEVSFEEFKRLLKEGKVTKTVGVHLTPTLAMDSNGNYIKDSDGEYIIGGTITMGPTSTVGIGKEDYSQKHTEDHYLKKVESFFPNLKLSDIGLHQAGIRAKLKSQYDFVIERDGKQPNCINLIGIDSPGLTSSLAIAKYVVEIFKN